MQILYSYFKQKKKHVFVSLLLACAAQLLSLVDPIIFGKIIDECAINSKSLPQNVLIQQTIFWLVTSLLISMIARICKTYQDYLTHEIVHQFGIQIFDDGLKQSLQLSFEEFEELQSGEILSILHKVRNDSERFVNSIVNILFSTVIGMSFLVWYSFTKNWLMVPIFLCGILIVGVLTSTLSNRIKLVQRAINSETNKMAGSITESLRNIELIKSLGLTLSEIQRLKALTKCIYDLEMIKIRKVRELSFFQGSSLNLLRQSILFMLFWLIFKDKLTTGELITMQFISSSVFIPLQDLGNIILNYREVDASIETYKQLMQKKMESCPIIPQDIGLLESISFKNVSFRHKTADQNSINNISFSVRSGETIAFVGSSGSGKSTLIKLLVGLYSPLSGVISYNNINSDKILHSELRNQIGLVTQDTMLFSGTIKENLLFVKASATNEELSNALAKASYTNLHKRTKYELNCILGEGGMKMSGGEKQRISIARAVLRNPRLLIFDEATSALDSITEHEITNTIRSISFNKERITILIAHRLSTIMHADTIYVLENGEISEMGNHSQLLAHEGLYNALWRQQIGEKTKEKGM